MSRTLLQLEKLINGIPFATTRGAAIKKMNVTVIIEAVLNEMNLIKTREANVTKMSVSGTKETLHRFMRHSLLQSYCC